MYVFTTNMTTNHKQTHFFPWHTKRKETFILSIQFKCYLHYCIHSNVLIWWSSIKYSCFSLPHSIKYNKHVCLCCSSWPSSKRCEVLIPHFSKFTHIVECPITLLYTRCASRVQGSFSTSWDPCRFGASISIIIF